jgi:hypothetical protein
MVCVCTAFAYVQVFDYATEYGELETLECLVLFVIYLYVPVVFVAA